MRKSGARAVAPAQTVISVAMTVPARSAGGKASAVRPVGARTANAGPGPTAVPAKSVLGNVAADKSPKASGRWRQLLEASRARLPIKPPCRPVKARGGGTVQGMADHSKGMAASATSTGSIVEAKEPARAAVTESDRAATIATAIAEASVSGSVQRRRRSAMRSIRTHRSLRSAS